MSSATVCRCLLLSLTYPAAERLQAATASRCGDVISDVIISVIHCVIVVTVLVDGVDVGSAEQMMISEHFFANCFETFCLLFKHSEDRLLRGGSDCDST